MTEFLHSPALTSLPPSIARLAAALARPRWIAIACVAVLAGTGWLALGLMAVDAGFLESLCRAAFSEGWSEFALVLPMWLAMTLAMMLPTAGPMILTYAEIADTAARKREPAVSPLVLVAGYVAVWVGFALAAAAAQVLLTQAAYLTLGQADRLASGALFVAAGLYQFTALKRACLTQCQRPFPFFFANWTAELRGVFRLGLRQGLFCLGCCWAMMLLMFALGVMNAAWMAALGAVMALEKLTTTQRLARAVGLACIAIGAGLVTLGLL